MKNFFQQIKKINLRLFFALLLMGLIPTIYTTFRIYFLGDIPSDWGVNIASQITYVNLIYEILQEALILPLFFMLGSIVHKRKEFNEKVKAGLIITFVFYATMSIIIFIFARPLVLMMAQNQKLVDATTSYIRLETIAFIFSTMVKFILVVLTLIKKSKLIYYVLLTQMILTIILDTFLLSQLSFSLKLGVNGIAITNILVNALLLMVSLVLLKKNNINVFSKKKIDFSWIKQWFRQSIVSGMETLIRNIAFMFMIIKMINVVAKQGEFWIANNFIWGWLLIPIIQLGELIKSDYSEDLKRGKSNFKGYINMTTLIVLFWIITIPFWPWFLENVMNVKNFMEVFNLILISIIFYIAFAFNNIIDSIFYGIGKVKYMLFQSVLINSTIYGIAFILYLAKIYNPTLLSIALMFGFGILFDSIVTFIMYWYFNKKGQIKYQDKEKFF